MELNHGDLKADASHNQPSFFLKQLGRSTPRAKLLGQNR